MSHEYSTAATQAARWYDLFSRGARDWLRHNEKVRESVRNALPDLVSGADVLTNPDNRVVRVPVRFLEHYRFRLRDADTQSGAGQGQGVKPGDVLRPSGDGGRGSGGAGTGEGGLEFVVELKIDDLLDWIWDELKLPHLEPKAANTLEDTDFVREGWDKRGVRARLDRRRTLREAVKRRAVQGDAIPFSNEDLRFRQLARRPHPSTVAVIIYVLDVSSSMDEESRRLAKTFFFWSLQGLRRQHTRIESVFVGHTVNAWEFSEEEFFQVRAAGGTEASSGLELAQRILEQRYDPGRYNSYLFYASDGDNFAADHDAAWSALRNLASRLNFMGYLEVNHRGPERLHTEMGRLFGDLMKTGACAGAYSASGYEDVWEAIREFFVRQAEIKGE
nr:DUF444 family protein [Gammaproteobacteria bacterium]